jgi:hypothetical protein
VLEKAIDRVKLTLRNKVRSKGSVDIGGGKEYVLIEQEEKQLNVKKAMKVLAKRIGDPVALGIARIPLNEVLTAFGNKAPRGQKQQARKQLFEELDAAGAVVRAKTTKMWRRPKGEKILEETP